MKGHEFVDIKIKFKFKNWIMLILKPNSHMKLQAMVSDNTVNIPIIMEFSVL